MIMIIILAVLGDDCGESAGPQSVGGDVCSTVAYTIPLAFMGIYMRFLRPGRIGEVSVIGLSCCCSPSIWFGWVVIATTVLGPGFDL